MLDSNKLSYMEAGRNALALSLRLSRIADGRVLQEDLEAIQKAAGELSNLVTTPEAPADTPLFATAEGLSLIIHACDRELQEHCEELEPMAADLQDFSKVVKASHLTEEMKKAALRFSLFFEMIHALASEMISNSDELRPSYAFSH